MPSEELLIDADGHILEPPDLWEKYLEPKYRARAVRIRVGDDGFEFLEIDGQRAQLTSAALLASLGGMKKLREMGEQVESFNAGRRDELKENAQHRHAVFDSLSTGSPEDTYLSGCAPGAMNLQERIEILRNGRTGRRLQRRAPREAQGKRTTQACGLRQSQHRQSRRYLSVGLCAGSDESQGTDRNS